MSLELQEKRDNLLYLFIAVKTSFRIGLYVSVCLEVWIS